MPSAMYIFLYIFESMLENDCLLIKMFFRLKIAVVVLVAAYIVWQFYAPNYFTSSTVKDDHLMYIRKMYKCSEERRPFFGNS